MAAWFVSGAWAQTPPATAPGGAPPVPPHFRQLPPLPHRRGHSPCIEQPSVFLFAPPPPPPLHTAVIPPPAKAVAAHVTGCAGIRFHIGADGKARDITVVMEFPGEFGMGDTARQVIASSLWAPRHDNSWYYVNLKMNPLPPPAQKPN
jgi:hypothetical protein